MFLKLRMLNVGLKVSLFVGIFLMPQAEGQALTKPWQVIQHLHSSRSDVYELFGSPHQTDSTPIFEQYGLISAEQENAILDNFAIQLLSDPNLTGKVILRRGQYSQKFAAQKLKRIKNYLYRHRNVPANRISAFGLQSGRDYTVELYLWKSKRSSGED